MRRFFIAAYDKRLQLIYELGQGCEGELTENY